MHLLLYVVGAVPQGTATRLTTAAVPPLLCFSYSSCNAL